MQGDMIGKIYSGFSYYYYNYWKDATRQKTWRLFSCQTTFHHGLLFQDLTLAM